MSDLRKFIVSALKSPLTLSEIEDKIRDGGWTSRGGISAFIILAEVVQLMEENLVRVNLEGKHTLVPGREKQAAIQPPQKKTKSRDLKVIMLAKRWTNNTEDQDKLADAIQAMVDKKKSVLLVNGTKEGVQVELLGDKSKPVFGTTVSDAIGNAVVLYNEKLRIDIQAG